MFFLLRGIIVWFIWIIFADKKRWREITPVCILAALLGVITDVLVEFYPYWEYIDDDIHPLYLELGDEFEIFPVVVYLFIQWMPKQQSLLNMFAYWVLWTSFAISIEYIHIVTEHMEHLNGWSLWHSYVSDWILFYIFYKFHKVFRLEKLSRD